jgi:2-keto-myo-inositol isomerase
MITHKLSRRSALKQTGLILSAAVVSHEAASPQASAGQGADSGVRPFRYCLNLSTLRGHKLGIVKEVEIASKAGYEAIEPWVDSIQKYRDSGGDLKELRRRISDAGLTVEGAIGFPEWLADDEEKRAKGVERAKREMDLIAQIGGKRFAAPAAGATDLPRLDLVKAGERYRALLEEGDRIGIVPELELWGFSKNLSRLGECVWVAMETGHPKACVLADAFHMYKGGSDFHGMRLLGPTTLQVFHLNDYPAEPPREKIDDSFRVYPGDGIAPLPEIVRLLHATGGQKVLSLELFNRKYWAEDPLEVAKTGLAKMKGVVEKAQV